MCHIFIVVPSPCSLKISITLSPVLVFFTLNCVECYLCDTVNIFEAFCYCPQRFMAVQFRLDSLSRADGFIHVNQLSSGFSVPRFMSGRSHKSSVTNYECYLYSMRGGTTETIWEASGQHITRLTEISQMGQVPSRRL